MKKENILGFDVCNISAYDLVDNIFQDFNNDISNFIVNVNPEIITKNYKNETIKNIFNEQKYQIPDGIGIVLASKIRHGKIKKRIAGIDLMHLICKESLNHDCKIFLYGSKDDIAENAKKELEKLLPDIQIVGTCNGYEDEHIVINKINLSKANILFVGLGCPKQEEFIINNRNQLPNIRIFMPIGGSLDVFSKSLKRAPNWIIKINMEWLYRLVQEPKRFFRQFSLIKFVFLIIFRRKQNVKN